MLLDFLNLGSGAVTIIVLILILLPTIFIIYCIVDILRSNFKTSIHKIAFLALVIFAPFIGSVIYIVIRNEYKLPKTPTNLPFN